MIIDTPFTARRRGFNLIEVALVLGVIGLAASGIWVVSATINENLKVNDFTAGILTACDRASISFPAKMSPPSYIGIWPPVLVAAKIFPQSWGFKNGNIEPPLGVMGTTYWMDSNQGAEYTGEVRINITSITESQCLKILPKLSMASRDLVRQIDVLNPATTSFSPPYTGSFSAMCATSSSIAMQFRCTAR